jgi:hypothetical protein
VTSRYTRAPHPAPPCEVTAQRPCTGARLRTFFQIRNAMSRNYFLIQLMPIWQGFSRCATRDISGNVNAF